MRERDVEKRLVREVERRGGLCLKFTSTSLRGVPDRIVVYEGLTCFVELKRPGEEPRPLQKKIIKQLQQNGALVFVISDLEELQYFMNWLTGGDEA